MPPSDDKQYPLVSNTAAPRVRRGIDARDYKLPKPYRKKKFVEDEQPSSPLRIRLLAFAGLVIAGLVVTLAMLAKENLDSPPPLIVAAPRPATVQPTTLPLPVAAEPELRLAQAPPALPPRTIALPPRSIAPPSRSIALAPRAIAPPSVHGRVTPPPALRRAAPPKSVAAAADPDVVLITAILMLTPPSAPAPANPTLADCSTTPSADVGCQAIHGVKP